MTNEEKNLLLKDLCARLPYEVEIQVNDWTLLDTTLKIGHIARLLNGDIKLMPYLRPMSSMTDEETETYHNLCIDEEFDEYGHIYMFYYDTIESIDYLNSIHVDYRDLITKGLAIEAPEGMYNFK